MSTGAELIADLLVSAGVVTGFAYPGTSELPLCVELLRKLPSGLRQPYGDAEAVFMGAGACAQEPGTSLAVLHAARGLGAATGAIADVARNEVGLVLLVGLPGTRSARFLPPHGEPGMVAAVSQFTKGHLDLSEFSIEDLHQTSVVDAVLEHILRLVHESSTPPFGPVLVGVPLDLAEQSWADPSADHAMETALLFQQQPAVALDESALRNAADLLAAAERVGVLVDDYFLHLPDAQECLSHFSRIFASPVFQVGYRRGPMLFPMIDGSIVADFRGTYVPGDAMSAQFAHDVDLLVTIEDRNMYRRVVGELPRCRKLAITSARERTEKNEYLAEDDLLLEGDPVAILRQLVPDGGYARPRSPWFTSTRSDGSPRAMEGLATSGDASLLAERLLQLLLAAEVGQIVDDSQAFGGAVASGAAALLPRFQVFGDHGGYVGAGLPFATGLALSTGARVACLLGDHAFVNGSQALFAVARYRPPICIVVCSNGGSVTLTQQVRDSYGDDAAARTSDLMAAPPVDLVAYASSLGIAATRVSVTRDAGATPLDGLEDAVTRFAASGEPALITIECPGDLDFWAGIWHSHGLDEEPAVTR